MKTDISISTPYSQPLLSGLRFAVPFVVCAVLATALASLYAPESFLDFCLQITIKATKALGFLLGVSVTSDADIMTVNGFAMRIITQCTALHYVIILTTAILLYSRHTISYRLAGVLICVPAVIIANALRLIITGMIGSISWDAFVIVHDYLWVAAFSLLVLGIWIIWAEQRFTPTWATVTRCGTVVLTCTAVYGVLLCALPLYGSFIATTASMLFKTLVGDSGASIAFNGTRMLYRYSNGELSANFTPDIMAVSLYLGLILSAGGYTRETIQRGLLGVVLILCLSVAIIAGGGALAVRSGNNAAVLFLWTAHGVLLQLTLLWWMLGRSARIHVPSASLVAVPE